MMCDYADQELTESLKIRIDSHIEQCPHCTELKAGYLQTISLAKELKNVPMPEGAQQRLRAKLNERLGINLPIQPQI